MAQYELSLRDYWRVLRKRRWIILFIFCAIFISTFVYNSMQPHIYQASSSVRYTEQRLLATLLTELIQNPVGDVMLSQSKLIESWNVAELAAKSLGWIKTDITPVEEANRVISFIQSSVSAKVETDTDLIIISVQHSEPQKTSEIANAVAQGYQQYNLLEKSRQASNLRQTVESRLSQISAELTQTESELKKFKEQNPDVTGAAIPSYNRLEELKKEEKLLLGKYTPKHPDVITTTLPAYKRLEELKKEEKLLLRKYTPKNPDVIATTVPAYNRLEELKKEKGLLLRKYTPKHPDVIKIDKEIEVLQEELQKEIEVSQKESQKEFKVLQEELQKEIEVSQKELQKEIEVSQKELQKEIEVSQKELQKEIEALQKEIEVLQKELGKYPAKELTLSQLKRNIDINNTLYSDLKQQFERARIAEGEKTSDVTIVNLALTPTKPIKPNKTTNQMIGLILGLLISLSAAFLIEHLDTSIGTIEDIEELVKLPVLGVIPYLSPASQLNHHSRHKKGFFTSMLDATLDIFPVFRSKQSSKPQEKSGHRQSFSGKTDKAEFSVSEQLRFQLVWNYSPTSPLVESYRTLRTNLIRPETKPELNKVGYEDNNQNSFTPSVPSPRQARPVVPISGIPSSGGRIPPGLSAGKEDKNQIIVITSTGPQEGKTITACNLAITMALKGEPVLLIDMDMRRPIIHKIFGLDKENGLSDILIGSKKLDDCLHNITDMLVGGVNWDLVMNTPGVENLHIIAAGTPVDNPSELLSRGVENLFNDLRSRYRHIICDCPPVLPVTDVLVLGPKTDLTTLVYRAGKTAKSALLRAKQYIISSQINLKGLIFNYMTPEIEVTPTYYYQYYKYYPSDKETKEPKNHTS